MKILIESIPHDQQRYPTVGDWQVSLPNNLTIRVSHMRDSRYMLLVAIHELVEATLCAHHGIKQSSVDAFDKLFEAERAQGAHPDDAEPGNSPAAPYHREHLIATAIEKQMAHWLEVRWLDYEKAIDAL